LPAQITRTTRLLAAQYLAVSGSCPCCRSRVPTGLAPPVQESRVVTGIFACEGVRPGAL